MLLVRSTMASARSAFFTFLSVLYILFFLLSCQPAPEEALKIGEKAPGFGLSDIGNKKVSLVDFEGKVVLIEFWATWCPPCIESIPYLNSLHEKYKEKDFVVLGINVDEGIEMEKLGTFTEDFEITYPILIDDDLTSKLYYVGGIPVSFLLDREHKVIRKYFGYNPSIKEKLSEDVEELL